MLVLKNIRHSGVCEKEVTVSAYDANELRLVVAQCECVAFQDGVLEDGIIAMCVCGLPKDFGGTRKALDLLLEAGDVASENEAVTVSECMSSLVCC